MEGANEAARKAEIILLRLREWKNPFVRSGIFMSHGSFITCGVVIFYAIKRGWHGIKKSPGG